jgi:hypothetical protein
VKSSVTPEQQAFLDARLRYQALRKQHIRRTQVIAGRLYLGRWLMGLLGVAVLVCPIALVFASLGWADVKFDHGNAAGLGVGTIAVVLLIAASGGHRQSAKRLVTGTGVVLFGAAIVANRAAALLLGGLLCLSGLSVLVTTTIWLVTSGLRAVFKRPKPIELAPIEQKPAA